MEIRNFFMSFKKDDLFLSRRCVGNIFHTYTHNIYIYIFVCMYVFMYDKMWLGKYPFYSWCICNRSEGGQKSTKTMRSHFVMNKKNRRVDGRFNRPENNITSIPIYIYMECIYSNMDKINWVPDPSVALSLCACVYK